jgi:hypothetical protein
MPIVEKKLRIFLKKILSLESEQSSQSIHVYICDIKYYIHICMVLRIMGMYGTKYSIYVWYEILHTCMYGVKNYGYVWHEILHTYMYGIKYYIHICMV